MWCLCVQVTVVVWRLPVSGVDVSHKLVLCCRCYCYCCCYLQVHRVQGVWFRFYDTYAMFGKNDSKHFFCYSLSVTILELIVASISAKCCALKLVADSNICRSVTLGDMIKLSVMLEMNM